MVFCAYSHWYILTANRHERAVFNRLQYPLYSHLARECRIVACEHDRLFDRHGRSVNQSRLRVYSMRRLISNALRVHRALLDDMIGADEE